MAETEGFEPPKRDLEAFERELGAFGEAFRKRQTAS